MLHYVTTNPGKTREAREYLGGEVAQTNFDYPEIQASELGPIAAEGARSAYREVGEPVIVDDAGLFVETLDGFPGPYSSYVEETLGVERVWQIGKAEEDRRASFRCVIAYCDGQPFDASPDPVDRADRHVAAASDEEGEGDDAGSLPVKLFTGRVQGTLVAPRGEGGFGYDPIFEHDGQTLAEMDTEAKNAISHRGRALAKFAEWFAQR
ncbi:non-canonical purine NTP pyrophosphatase [Salinirubrum litoreum]|uniref:Non-canonical purine NTP pyrophosphatase n=1 Tax=Salinirubrum litoreum TaxID=1126234 RepID=A0ABD5RBZ5_9EURY|nr:non-canonical purine NTP pyrophosphatase [Salinirubrum litoreum]